MQDALNIAVQQMTGGAGEAAQELGAGGSAEADAKVRLSPPSVSGLGISRRPTSA